MFHFLRKTLLSPSLTKRKLAKSKLQPSNLYHRNVKHKRTLRTTNERNRRARNQLAYTYLQRGKVTCANALILCWRKPLRISRPSASTTAAPTAHAPLCGIPGRDPRFRVIDKANSGYGASMNQGLDAATGEYVAILESDDAFTPDALEVLHGLATEYHAQAVKADFWFYWSKNEKLEPCHVISEGLCGKLVNRKRNLSRFTPNRPFGRECTAANSCRKTRFDSWKHPAHRTKMRALPLRCGHRPSARHSALRRF